MFETVPWEIIEKKVGNCEKILRVDRSLPSIKVKIPKQLEIIKELEKFKGKLDRFFEYDTGNFYPLSAKKIYIVIISYKGLEITDDLSYENLMHTILHVMYENGYSMMTALNNFSCKNIVRAVKVMNKEHIFNIDVTEEERNINDKDERKNENIILEIVKKIVDYIDSTE